MSEKFEQRKTTIGEEALEKTVAKNQPFENKNTPIDSSKNEFEKTSDERELFEGSSYIDKKEYRQDLTEETLRIAEDAIGKLLHKKQMEGIPIENNANLLDQFKKIIIKKEHLESTLRGLEKNNEVSTPRYNSVKSQYEDALSKFRNLESRVSNTPDGNLILQVEKVSKLEDEITDRENALSPEDPSMN